MTRFWTRPVAFVATSVIALCVALPKTGQALDIEDVIAGAAGAVIVNEIIRNERNKRTPTRTTTNRGGVVVVPSHTVTTTTTSTSTGTGFTRAEKREIQTILNQLGYNAGVVDGQYGRKTRNAAKGFQSDYGYAATGYLSRSQYRALQEAGVQNPTRTSGLNPNRALTRLEITQLQTHLGTIGYYPGRADGNMGVGTRRGLTEFISDHNYNPQASQLQKLAWVTAAAGQPVPAYLAQELGATPATQTAGTGLTVTPTATTTTTITTQPTTPLMAVSTKQAQFDARPLEVLGVKIGMSEKEARGVLAQAGADYQTNMSTITDDRAIVTDVSLQSDPSIVSFDTNAELAGGALLDTVRVYFATQGDKAGQVIAVARALIHPGLDVGLLASLDQKFGPDSFKASNDDRHWLASAADFIRGSSDQAARQACVGAPGSGLLVEAVHLGSLQSGGQSHYVPAVDASRVNSCGVIFGARSQPDQSHMLLIDTDAFATGGATITSPQTVKVKL